VPAVDEQTIRRLIATLVGPISAASDVRRAPRLSDWSCNMFRPTLVIVGALFVLNACGKAPPPEVSAEPKSATPPMRGSANLITLEEITTSGASDALQVVKLLRPAMLRGRNGSMNNRSGLNEIVVYVDGVRSGGPGTLENISAISIREIRFINAADATTRFGTGHAMGAILVVSQR